MNTWISLTTYGHQVTKVQCLWPSSWDYWYSSFQFWTNQATGDLSWLVFLYIGHVDKSCFPRQAQVVSVRYQHHASDSCFSSVSASAHTCLRELMFPEKSHSSLSFSSTHQKTKEKWAAAKPWKFLETTT